MGVVCQRWCASRDRDVLQVYITTDRFCSATFRTNCDLRLHSSSAKRQQKSESCLLMRVYRLRCFRCSSLKRRRQDEVSLSINLHISFSLIVYWMLKRWCLQTSTNSPRDSVELDSANQIREYSGLEKWSVIKVLLINDTGQSGADVSLRIWTRWFIQTLVLLPPVVTGFSFS